MSDLVRKTRLKSKKEVVCSDNLKAYELLSASAWANGLRRSNSQSVSIQIDAGSVAVLNKYLVDQHIGVTSLRAMNSLEAYFLSLTSGNDVS